jgi:hypothetical protein
MKRLALAIAFLISGVAVSLAQVNVQVVGPITPGDCAQFSSSSIVKDGGFPCNGAPGNAITAVTGDGTATGPGSVPFTLATVNPNVGSFGSATQCVAITTNGKGLITAAAAVTCTPAIASITGLGTGVAAALANALNGFGGLVGFCLAAEQQYIQVLLCPDRKRDGKYRRQSPGDQQRGCNNRQRFEIRRYRANRGW